MPDKKPSFSDLELRVDELTSVMSSISDAILAVDLKMGPLFYNSRFAVIFGVEEAFTNPEIAEVFNYTVKTGEPSSIKIMAARDEQKQFFSLSVSPLTNKKNEIYGAVGVFHDVTELKKAEKMRIEFVANVSHELRTPLTAIKGYTDTLKLDLDEKKPIEPSFLDVISRNTDRLIHLINDLLDLSALESTNESLNKTEIDTKNFSEKIIEQLRPDIRKKSHHVTVTANAPTVHADPGLLEQVVNNLVGNAIKYCPENNKIEVIWESEGSSTFLKVRDNGPGIPKKHHDRLFERFYRIDKARSREMGGTGLGLAIVKHIMQRHGGSVVLDSESGKGTEFKCYFPSPP